MHILKEKHFTDEIENGEHKDLEVEALRGIVAQVYDLEANNIDLDNMSDDEVTEKYGAQFQERVREETEGVRFIVEPGWQTIESYINQIKRHCRDKGIKVKDITSGPVSGGNFFGEALIIEALGKDDILAIRRYLEDME